jgi:hypothetical protein
VPLTLKLPLSGIVVYLFVGQYGIEVGPKWPRLLIDQRNKFNGLMALILLIGLKEVRFKFREVIGSYKVVFFGGICRCW